MNLTVRATIHWHVLLISHNSHKGCPTISEDHCLPCDKESFMVIEATREVLNKTHKVSWSTLFLSLIIDHVIEVTRSTIFLEI